MNKVITTWLWLIPAFAYADITCHLHPRGMNTQNEQSPRLIGPFANQQQCEKENERIYQLKGRCHCSFTNPGLPFIYKEFDSGTERNIPVP